MIMLSDDDKSKVLEVVTEILQTFLEQVDGWKNRPVFERQWVLRDFKKYTGAAPEYFADILSEFKKGIANDDLTKEDFKELPVEKLRAYYEHQIDLLKGYEKNPNKIKEYSSIMTNWINTIEKFNEFRGRI